MVEPNLTEVIKAHIFISFNTLKRVILTNYIVFVKLSFTLCCVNQKSSLYLCHNRNQYYFKQKLIDKYMNIKFDTT